MLRWYSLASKKVTRHIRDIVQIELQLDDVLSNFISVTALFLVIVMNAMINYVHFVEHVL